ncbi:hypothetical protein BANRA_04357 [Escherichia coli]|nr:hypothetical protein BANRA_04357 [Escherichia coli]
MVGLKHIQDCIERLWKVSIIAQNGRKRQGFRLLSEYASDEADGRLRGPEPDRAGRQGGGQHVRISMDEVRALDSETARLLHQRLWAGSTRQNRQASIDTLWLCLAVRGQWFDHARAASGARGVAGAGRAGLDGNRVRGSTTSPGPRRLTPLYCKQDILSFISMAYFPANW